MVLQNKGLHAPTFFEPSDHAVVLSGGKSRGRQCQASGPAHCSIVHDPDCQGEFVAIRKERQRVFAAFAAIHQTSPLGERRVVWGGELNLGNANAEPCLLLDFPQSRFEAAKLFGLPQEIVALGHGVTLLERGILAGCAGLGEVAVSQQAPDPNAPLSAGEWDYAGLYGRSVALTGSNNLSVLQGAEPPMLAWNRGIARSEQLAARSALNRWSSTVRGAETPR
jgi:hypothetical protein